MTTLARISHSGCQSVAYLINGKQVTRDAYYDRFDNSIVDSFATVREGRNRDGCERFRHTCEAR